MGAIDFLVHAIGFADKNELRGRYVDTSRAGFALAMDISVYSFTAVCQRASAMMGPGGSLLTLTYSGPRRSCRITT
jgi:enoyl-[acyl-carrier protein] reductase I